jgi:divalent metal cation (Fe/Co/Zn/Cd) transporter
MGYASLQQLIVVTSSTTDAALHGPLWLAMAAGGMSLVVKEALFHATKAAGERAGSKVMMHCVILRVTDFLLAGVQSIPRTEIS